MKTPMKRLSNRLTLELAMIVQHLSWRVAIPQRVPYANGYRAQCTLCFSQSEAVSECGAARDLAVEHSEDCLVKLAAGLLARLPPELKFAATDDEYSPTTPTGKVLYEAGKRRDAENSAYLEERKRG